MAHPNAKKRNKAQIEKDRTFSIDLYLKGNSLRWIAQEISNAREYSLSHQQIFDDVKVVLKQWGQERTELIDHYKTIELEKLNKLEKEYWEAWDKSKEDYKQKAIKMKKMGETESQLTEQQIKEMVQFGDPRFLSGIERCIERRCKILGIDAPAKLDIEQKVIEQIYRLGDGTEIKF